MEGHGNLVIEIVQGLRALKRISIGGFSFVYLIFGEI